MKKHLMVIYPYKFTRFEYYKFELANYDFKIDILSYEGDNSWMDNTIIKIKETLESNSIPDGNKNCIHCNYRSSFNDN